MKTILLLIVLLCFALSGCSGSFELARVAAPKPLGAPVLVDERCRDIDDSRMSAAAWGKGALAVAGGSGASAFPLDRVVNDDTARAVAFGVVSGAVIVAGVVGLVATFRADQLAEQYVREGCGTLGSRK